MSYRVNPANGAASLDFEGMLLQLQDTYMNMVRALEDQREANRHEARRAWEELEEEKAELARQRRELERERMQMGIGGGGGSSYARGATSGQVLDLSASPYRRSEDLASGVSSGGTQTSTSSSGSPSRVQNSRPTRYNNNEDDPPLLASTSSYRTPSRAGGQAGGGSGRSNSSPNKSSFNNSSLMLNGSPSAPMYHQKQHTATSDGVPVWVTLWPGIHRNGRPHRVLVHPQYRLLQQLIEKAAQEMRCQPSPNILYTPDGRTVSQLNEIAPGGDYLILPSGCLYREDSVPNELLERLVSNNVRGSGGGTGRMVAEYQ